MQVLFTTDHGRLIDELRELRCRSCLPLNHGRLIVELGALRCRSFLPLNHGRLIVDRGSVVKIRSIKVQVSHCATGF